MESAEASSRTATPAEGARARAGAGAGDVPPLPTIAGSPNIEKQKKPPSYNMSSNAAAAAPVKSKRALQKRTRETEAADRNEEAATAAGRSAPKAKPAVAPVKRDQVTTMK